MSNPIAPLWVVKSGSGLLARDAAARIQGWMAEIARLRREEGVRVVWVFSGTLSAGRKAFRSANRQAVGAVGQMELLGLFSHAMSMNEQRGAQVLVMTEDFEEPSRRESLRTLLGDLIGEGIVPIVNENDARGETTEGTSTSRLYRNNDRVAGEIARLLEADRLVFLTEVGGVYSANPVFDPQAQKLDELEPEEIQAILTTSGSEKTSASGTGGMRTKLEAALKAGASEIEVFIGSDFNTGTRILPRRRLIDSIRKDSRAIARASVAVRDLVLEKLEALIRGREDLLLAANRADLDALDDKTPSAFRERMTLNPARMREILEGVRAVRLAPDPLSFSERSEAFRSPHGLRIRRRRSPFGVLFMIFESRPNVAVEGFAAAMKSGNAVILRGGKECARTLGAFYSIFTEVLGEVGLPHGVFIGITNPDRWIVARLLQRKDAIDVVIPRGGDSLIEFVTRHSLIPMIKNDRGLCHVYVDAQADLGMAMDIVVNAKMQRPSVCNAIETLLVHREIAARFLPMLYTRMRGTGDVKGVEFRACPETCEILGGRAFVVSAGEKDWDTEHLGLRMNVRIVGALEEAIAHIERHGSRHSEAIVTSAPETARRFQAEVDAAVTYWNASTRFTDGFEFGLGSEIGISTQKLHVRGPVGIEALTSLRWVVDGEGQVRNTPAARD